MPEHSKIEMTRKQLYDEIWEMSVTGVAKKYNLPYAHLMKQIKEASIPIPPSGYWTKLNFSEKNSDRAEMETPVAESSPTFKVSELPLEEQTLSVSVPKKDEAI
ncbi:hypothetical protein J2Z22_000678 [Paenibacillus forsythiae]|uniref:Uncharacterized protein n=1 Tax=Paenibacillus forsythiae TaxID=365616 RepID=A0ABU3H346_9BACL|nr:hypothetical protein [Paenibacillus forsythiae]MDT3425165.1 hypothetical protein [Paenibacillus forsythiae]